MAVLPCLVVPNIPAPWTLAIELLVANVADTTGRVALSALDTGAGLANGVDNGGKLSLPAAGPS